MLFGGLYYPLRFTIVRILGYHDLSLISGMVSQRHYRFLQSPQLYEALALKFKGLKVRGESIAFLKQCNGFLKTIRSHHSTGFVI